MESLNWLILQRIYLVWLSCSYCFIFDSNYSSFALRLQTSQHLILDLSYLKQWKAAKIRAKTINQNPPLPSPPSNRTLLQKFVLGWNIVPIIFLVWSISLTSALILHRTAIVLLFSCGCLWYSSWHPRESFYSRGNIRSLEYQETC